MQFKWLIHSFYDYFFQSLIFLSPGTSTPTARPCYARFVFVFLFVFTFPCELLAATYFVAINGNNANDGSSASPWRTLQFAADQVVAGDTVIVRAGDYVGFVLGWDFPQNGTASQRITFSAEAGVTVVERNLRTPDGINLEGTSYITIEGFRVIGLPRAGIRSVLNEHVILRNNYGDNNGRWGILTGFSDDILIENNVMIRSQIEHGIYVGNSGDRPIIRGNLIWGNHANGIHINSDASAGGDGIISEALVEKNIIYDNGVGGGSGINCDGVQNSIIRNNLLYDNHASGISLYRIDGAQGASGNLVVNNTIIQAADGRWAMNIQNASVNTTLRNNIFLSLHSFRGAISIDSSSLSGLQSDRNVMISRFTLNGGNSVINLQAWRNATGQDQNSVIASPDQVFRDFAARDLELSQTSPAIDLGTATQAPTDDLLGVSRPQGSAHDAGAYEYRVVCDPNGDPGGPDVGPPPSNDSDGDGVSDPQELIDGTDPADPGSFRSKLVSPVYTVWNGFLNMTGVLELVNTGDINAEVSVAMYTLEQGYCNRVVFTLAPGEQRDLIINEMNGFARDSYGTLKITYSGSIDGRVLSYRPSSSPGEFEFAFAVPLRNPSYGTSAVAYNTYQPSFRPSDQTGLVANWLTLINLGQSAQSFHIDYRDQTGALVQSFTETIPAKGRIDRQGGHEFPGKDRVGVLVVRPVSSQVPYLSQLTRYGYGNSAGTSFTFAFPLIAKAGTGRTTVVPISSTLSASNWLEVANTLAQEVGVGLEFYGSNGESIANINLRLEPFAQRHFEASAILGPNRTGFVILKPQFKNSIISQSMFYIREPIDGSILAMYGSQAAEPLVAHYFGSYNRFLGMANWLKIFNPSLSTISTTVRVHHTGGQTERSFSIPAFNSIDVPVHDPASFNTQPDTYGIIEVLSGSAITSELLRVHLSPVTQKPDFLVPLRLQ